MVFSLTDEESRKNWEEYGNPDGPRGGCGQLCIVMILCCRSNQFWHCSTIMDSITRIIHMGECDIV